MVDTNKLKQQAGAPEASAGNAEIAAEGIEKDPKPIADLPKVNSAGETTRAWVVRLVVGLFAIIALTVLYFAYAESSKIRQREAQLVAMEESAAKVREEYESLTQGIASMREESSSLRGDVGKLTQEKNQLSLDIQDARKTITMAEQKEIEFNEISQRLANMTSQVATMTERQATVTLELQGICGRQCAFCWHNE